MTGGSSPSRMDQPARATEGQRPRSVSEAEGSPCFLALARRAPNRRLESLTLELERMTKTLRPKTRGQAWPPRTTKITSRPAPPPHTGARRGGCKHQVPRRNSSTDNHCLQTNWTIESYPLCPKRRLQEGHHAGGVDAAHSKRNWVFTRAEGNGRREGKPSTAPPARE